MSNNYVSIAISFFGSVVAIYLTQDLLFSYTTHAELWIIFFAVLFVFSSIFSISYYYTYRDTKHDIGWNSRQLLLSFIQMTLLMMCVRLVIDQISHDVATTCMTWIEYMGFFLFAVILIFVIFLRMQALIDQSGVGESGELASGPDDKKIV
jgi:uncharacterized membrane protein